MTVRLLPVLRPLAVAATFVLLALSPAAAQIVQPAKTGLDRNGQPEKLTGDQIKQTWFNGQPFVATGPDGIAYRMVFTEDGKSTRVAVAAKKPKATAGFWRVIAEGYCSRWAGSNREKCFNVRKSPDGSETVVRFGQQIAATWKRP